MNKEKITREDNAKPIFSSDKEIKKNSLKLFSYLTLIGNLRDRYDTVRVFQQKDITLKGIHDAIGLNERTIKKYWEFLEEDGLVVYSKRYEEDLELSFNKRWTLRKKKPEAYYEIPKPSKYRLIPQLTIEKLLKNKLVNELTYKIYVILLNYQEMCIANGKDAKYFTYKDLRDVLGYKKDNDIDRRIEDALVHLEALGLISFNKDEKRNSYGGKIPVFILTNVKFYIKTKITGYETDETNALSKTEIEYLQDKINFSEQIQDLLSKLDAPASSRAIKDFLKVVYSEAVIISAITNFGIDKINEYSKNNNYDIGLKIFYKNNYELLSMEAQRLEFKKKKEELEKKNSAENNLFFQKQLHEVGEISFICNKDKKNKRLQPISIEDIEFENN